MRYPVAEGSDFLLYHRFTGMEEHSTVAHVEQLLEFDFALKPHEDRFGDMDDVVEMFGFDPIDLAAGDGGAVFFTPFQPIGAGSWMKPSLRNKPGAAFRLSDVLACCKVSVRPEDLQTFYVSFVERSAVGDAYNRMQDEVDYYERAGYLEALSEALGLIRTAERWDAANVLQQLYAKQPVAHEPPGNLSLTGPVASAMDFVAEFSREGPDEFWESDEQVQALEESVAVALAEQIRAAWGAWKNVKLPAVEVLVWGHIPLDLACLFFDERRVVRRDCARGSR